jgi:hypothetical protein
MPKNATREGRRWCPGSSWWDTTLLASRYSASCTASGSDESAPRTCRPTDSRTRVAKILDKAPPLVPFLGLNWSGAVDESKFASLRGASVCRVAAARWGGCACVCPPLQPKTRRLPAMKIEDGDGSFGVGKPFASCVVVCSWLAGPSCVLRM